MNDIDLWNKIIFILFVKYNTYPVALFTADIITRLSMLQLYWFVIKSEFTSFNVQYNFDELLSKKSIEK